MQQFSSPDLILGLAAVTIAVWGQMIAAAKDEIDKWEHGPYQMIGATVVLVGGVGVTVAVVAGVMIVFGLHGGVGGIMAYLLLGSILLNIPHIAKLSHLAFLKEREDVSEGHKILRGISTVVVLLVVAVVGLIF